MTYYSSSNSITSFDAKTEKESLRLGVIEYESADRVNPVIDGALFVQKHIDLVKINEEGVKAAAKHIYSTLLNEGYSPHTWREHPLHLLPPVNYSSQDPRTKACLDWIFLISSLNFSFWSEKEGTEDESRRVGIEWRAGWNIQERKVWTGYWTLVAAINKALEAGIPITDPTFYASEVLCPDSVIENIFQPAYHCREEVPLLKERIGIMREVGSILVSKFGGSYAGLLAYFMSKYSSQGTALQLVEMMVNEFPSFRDEVYFEGRKICFWKRAQILIAETWAAFYPPPSSSEPHPFFPHGVGELTMFADYRVPQILHHLRIITYRPSIISLLTSRKNVVHGSAAELNIRAASILAVEAIRDEIALLTYTEASNNLGLISAHKEIPSVLIDFFLWDLAKKLEHNEGRIEEIETYQMLPAHRTRSIWY